MNGKFLVTGGAGFVGSNLVNNLLSDGCSVRILDSLSRSGTQNNLAWLRSQHGNGQLEFIQADIRDFASVRAAVNEVDAIYHLAGQVAVTSSVDDPRLDFEINTVGTLNLLEAARLSDRKPIIVFTSTNKVYGEMESVVTVEQESRYTYRDLPHGVSEAQPVDFHSPYGCSKGAADQYVRDYARIYGLRTVVFRMSCIYGPRQFGTEDQGWLAHFTIASETEKPITIYGNGKQVRDVLFVDDLVRAFRLAVEKIDVTAGQVYNIGGTEYHDVKTVSDLILRSLGKNDSLVTYKEAEAFTTKDKKIEVSRAERELDHQCRVTLAEGIPRTLEWMRRAYDAGR